VIQHHIIGKDSDRYRPHYTRLFLSCCEAWARHVAVPIGIVSIRSIAIAHLHHHVLDEDDNTTQDFQIAYNDVAERPQEVAYQYLVTIFESASHHPSQVVMTFWRHHSGVSGGGCQPTLLWWKPQYKYKKKHGSKK